MNEDDTDLWNGKPRPVCEECGVGMRNRRECDECYGDDEYGYEWWCDSDICHPNKHKYINCCGC